MDILLIYTRALDYAYGVQNCVDLANGSYKVGEDREYVAPNDPLCADFQHPAKVSKRILHIEIHSIDPR